MSHIEEIFYNDLKWLMIIKWDREATSGTFPSHFFDGFVLRVNRRRR